MDNNVRETAENQEGYVNTRGDMGQMLDRFVESREPYDENSDNGLILGEKYIPEELIAEILCYVDYKSLLNCQLVCKRWKTLLETYLWRKKAEMTLGRSLHSMQDLPWVVYAIICKKKPFERNLVKNHSGQDGVEKHWDILSQGGDHWKVESPPVGVPPLPSNEPVFEGQQSCFVTSYYTCSKQQIIDLASEGLTSELLDTLQPPIVVSEWYSCRWDCPAGYKCTVTLIGAKNKVLGTFDYAVSIEGEAQNQWHRVIHEFRNYGPGLKAITFYHGGTDNLFWAGHYGSKMAGACVCFKLPQPNQTASKESMASNVYAPFVEEPPSTPGSHSDDSDSIRFDL